MALRDSDHQTQIAATNLPPRAKVAVGVDVSVTKPF